MSNRTIIETLWGVRKGESVPELMDAWDEYSIDSYPDGWRESCAKAIASWGNDLDAYRYIDMDRIEAAFEPTNVIVDEHNAR